MMLASARGIDRAFIIDPNQDYALNVDATVHSLHGLAGFLDTVYQRERPIMAASQRILNLLRLDERTRSLVRREATVKPFRVSIVPDGMNEADLADLVSRQALFEEDCTVIIEESFEAASFRTCPPSLIRVAKRGRHHNVGLWLVSQRLSDIAANLRAEVTGMETWLFRMTDGTDLDRVSKMRRDRRLADKVAQLPKLCCLRLLPDLQEPERWQIVFEGGHPIMYRLS